MDIKIAGTCPATFTISIFLGSLTEKQPLDIHAVKFLRRQRNDESLGGTIRGNLSVPKNCALYLFPLRLITLRLSDNLSHVTPNSARIVEIVGSRKVLINRHFLAPHRNLDGVELRVILTALRAERLFFALARSVRNFLFDCPLTK